MTRAYQEIIEDAIADAGLNYSHLSDGDDGGVIVWYDGGRDDPDEIVQVVERETVTTYRGEKQYPHDDVTGLVFDPMPIASIVDIDATVESIIEKCHEAQGGHVRTIPVTAIDEGEMPDRLPDGTPQAVWDATRESIANELRERGFVID